VQAMAWRHLHLVDLLKQVAALCPAGIGADVEADPVVDRSYHRGGAPWRKVAREAAADAGAATG
jgi:hypothetical protein